jgi:hypothetical protein
MNKSYIVKASILRIFTLASALLLTSTNSLAELNTTEKLYIEKGFPYEGLVDRSEDVRIFYKAIADNISCRVEVLQDGQTWKGEERNISFKKFTQKPLHACLDRDDAKKLLANTF